MPAAGARARAVSCGAGDQSPMGEHCGTSPRITGSVTGKDKASQALGAHWAPCLQRLVTGGAIGGWCWGPRGCAEGKRGAWEEPEGRAYRHRIARRVDGGGGWVWRVTSGHR